MDDFGRRDWLRGVGLGLGVGITGTAAGKTLPGRKLPKPWTPDHGTWATPRFDPKNTAYSVNATPPTDSPTVAWTADVGTEVRSIAVTDGILFVGGEKAVVALDAESGTERWRHRGTAGTVAVRDGTVFAGGHDDEYSARALAAADGSVEWANERQYERCYHLLPAEDWLFVGAHSEVRALERDSGEVRWRFPTGLGDRGVALADGRAYVGQPGPAVALESRPLLGELTRDRPRVAWESPGPAFGLAPVRVGGHVVVADGEDGPYNGGHAGYLYAYDADSGAEQWRQKVEMNALAPAVHGDTLFAPGLTYDDVARPGVVRALDARTGAVLWSTRLPRWPSGAFGAGDLLLVGGGNRGTPGVTALDAETGGERWTVETDDDTDALAPVGDTVFAGSRAGTVYAIR
ncbi:PQQ-binding-like beta-propeller repeat protein [Halorussus gelatinilyticus]|uniref:PQQ-binding-like beta-propeller repeat protein n=1 Tax=Halorussus gelatinilyticus TaxID=2937524 RepID=A0A8U0IJP5_9EURY|nr:PQQ-binding-like beta-propeller repeat protein [Halorussus gelatinilyticus]UPW00905.1 PQQ-binding-like beta-propeller repeat protein [Halorussus gelatinilyticus]